MRPTPAGPEPAAPATEPGAGELGRLVAECLELWEGEGPAALEKMCRANPAHAPALRRRVMRLQELGLLGEAPTDAPLPERLGGFRILSLVGRGGMGVVYLAEQEGLGRRVALKLVRPENLFFPGARERFRREVQAIARLAHPGIVPVHAGGEEAGVPFCAMEFVRGASLAEVIDELAGREPASLAGSDLLATVQELVRRRDIQPASVPATPSGVTSEAAARLSAGTWTAACLRVARQVAEALQHAHEHGVLHRDVKPGNIMLTPEGRVLLLDFGLAAAEGSVRLTSTGGQVGSLAWMSPEQLRGQRDAVDARSDVYSLGATLYEMLTLRTPFAGDSVEATRGRILAGRVVPMRELNPSLPRDVETVCLTAMDSDPARRYADAAALAAELANVLELRPITARRPGPLLRARRWAQRRPAAATGVVLGTLLLIAFPLGWELNRVRTARQVREAGERAERDFQSALDAVGHVLREMGTDELEDVPRMQTARLAAIDRALELFPSLQKDRHDDLAVLTEGANLHASRGEVLSDLGRPQEALAECRAAIALRRRLLQLDPSPARHSDLAAILNQAGRAQFVTLEADAALPFAEEAVAELRLAIAADPANDHRRRSLAVSLANVSDIRQAQGDFAACDALLAEASQLATDLRERHPQDAEMLWTAGRIFGDVAELSGKEDRPDVRLQWAERALEAWRAAHAADPQRRYYAYDVSTGLYYCSVADYDLREFARAEGRLAEATDILAGLLRDFPESDRYLKRRAEVLELRATCAGQSGDYERALAALSDLLPEELARCVAEPARYDLQTKACQTRINIANSLIQMKVRFDEALALLADATTILQACDLAGALSADDRGMLSAAAYLRALALCETDRGAQARAAVEAFEAQAAGAWPLRQAADLWNEWLLSVRRTMPQGAARSAAEAEARERLLELLARAIDAGYSNVGELSSTPSLDSLRDDPTFVALLDRVQRAASGP
ncbi:MAG TPA: protein kinase [Planctomycetota bacterium]|nr:protein kinase [Planctomycetota bacterium]